MARRAAAVAVAVLGLVCALPAIARADPPVCPEGAFETDPGVPVQLPTPSCTNLPVAFFIPPDGNPANGMVTLGAPSVYTPNPGFHGVDTFFYQARNAGGEESVKTKVTVIVDFAPTCTSTAVTVPANTPTVIDLPCADADGDVLDIFVGDPSHGSVAFPGGNVVYTPAPGYSGPDSFTLASEDEFYSSEDATVNITVSPPPAPAPTVQPRAPVLKDVTAPAVTLKNAGKKQALAISVTTNENASATLTVALDKATARKLKLSQKVGTLKAALKPGTSTLKVKLSSKAVKAFKKLKSVKVTVTAVVRDAAGNTTTKTLKVTLKK
jgi:hypothetical protein